MTLLKKFFLTDKQFLTVGLNGAVPEIRLSSPRKYPLNLTPAAFEILVNSAPLLLKEKVTLSSTESSYGGTSELTCSPDEATGGLKFVTEELTFSQLLIPGELDVVRYTLTKNAALVFVEALPSAKEYVDFIANLHPDIQVAYSVIADQMKRLCQSHPGNPTDFEHFLFIIRILHQHVPLSFLISDFKRRSGGTLLNVSSLMNNVLHQFEYLYNNVFPNCV